MVSTTVPKTKQATTLNPLGDYNFKTIDNFSYIGPKIATGNSYDGEIRALPLATRQQSPFRLTKTVSLESFHHKVQAITVQDNDLASPHVVRMDEDDPAWKVYKSNIYGGKKRRDRLCLRVGVDQDARQLVGISN